MSVIRPELAQPGEKLLMNNFSRRATREMFKLGYKVPEKPPHSSRRPPTGWKAAWVVHDVLCEEPVSERVSSLLVE